MLNGKISKQIHLPIQRMTITTVKGFNIAAILKVSPSVQEGLKNLMVFFLFPREGVAKKSPCHHQHMSDQGIVKKLTSKPAVISIVRMLVGNATRGHFVTDLSLIHI